MAKNDSCRRSLAVVLLVAAATSFTGGTPAVASSSGIELDPALAARLHVRIFSDDDGLPQNSIEALALEPTGRLWATTREGGASFDGTRWSPVDMPDSAHSNWPRTLLVSPDGTRWFATEGGGVHRLAGSNWSSVAHPRIAGETVTALAETRTSAGARIIWAGSAAGLFRIDAAGLGTSIVPGFETRRVTALRAGTSFLLVGTSNGDVYRCNDQECSPFPEAAAAVGGARISAFAEANDGADGETLLIASDRGLASVGRNARSMELEGKRVNAVALTRDARGATTVWVALDGEGIHFRTDGQWHAIGLETGLPNLFVFALAPFPATGPTRHLFAGTLNGLVRFDLNSWRAVDADAGLPDASVVSMLETGVPGNRRYFLGTTAGLAEFDEGRWRRAGGDAVARVPVFALLESADRQIVWAGTNKGLARRLGGLWSLDAGLPGESVVSLLETSDRGETRLWAGTYGAGLWSRNRQGEWTRVEGLPDGRIEALLADESTGTLRVWAATNRGIAVIEGGRIKVIDRTAGLPADIIRTLYIATGSGGRRHIWAGTASGLAWRELGDDDARWEILSKRSSTPLPSDAVYQIRGDRENVYWLFTGRGVARLTFPDGAAPTAANAVVDVFTTADGLPGNECNFGASMIDSLGRVWAGTTRGAAIFDPGAASDDRLPKTLLMREVRVGKGLHDLAARSRFRHSENDLSFAFRLIDIGHGGQAQYRTQLVGSESEPGEWTRVADRTFTDLATGSYTLRVWGRDSEGNVSGPIEARFEVLAPPWFSWWAILAYLAAGIGLLATTHRIRLRGLRVKTEKLEKVVRSRTRDLERMNRELEAANTALADMSVTDPLTGAKNRRFLSQEMAREAGRVGRSLRSGDDLMFFIVDIDLFKNVNDRFGHTVGDAILRQFCGTLASAVRETDTIVRWGGEEFLVVARRSSRGEAPRIADRILEAVRAEVFDAFDGRLIQIGCSVGWAVFPFLPRDADLFAWDEVVDIADHCLLAAKSSGRDCWVGLSVGPSLNADTFFPRLRTSVTAMAESGELVVSTSLADVRNVRWQ